MSGSIARYLLLRLVLMLVVAGLVLAQLGIYWLDHSLRQYTHEQLQQQAQGLLFSLVRDEDDELVVNLRHHDAQYLQPFSGHYFIIQVDGEKFRSRSLWDFTLLEEETTMDSLLPGPGEQQQLDEHEVGAKQPRHAARGGERALPLPGALPRGPRGPDLTAPVSI